MEVVGYADIKKDATTGTSAIPISKFIDGPCRVMEFAEDGGVLVIDREAQGLAMFDKEDVYRKFKCGFCGEVVTPPNLSLTDKIIYAGKCMTRKGGYNNLLKQMVIQASLMKGEFYDHFLWAKQ